MKSCENRIQSIYYGSNLNDFTMSKTVMSVKVDKDVKEKAQKVAKSMGFPLGTIINAYLIQLVKNKTVFFSSDKTLVMSADLEKKLGRIDEDIQNNLNLSKTFDSVDGMIDELKK